MTSVGRRRPTQTVTIRRLLSTVIEPQSALWNVEARRMPRPSGPGPRLASVWKASSWRLLRSFGAMNGWRGTSGTEIGCWMAGDPENKGGGLLLEPSGIGIALAAVAVAPATASKSTNRLRSRRRRVAPTTERLAPAGGPPLRFAAPVAGLEQTTLANGLPLIRIPMEGTRAVTALVAFDAGARTEREEENGMAHFLEHLVFKGGESYPTYRDVNETAERIGAQLNAYTSHDLVAFHITCRSELAGQAIDLLTDFVGRARIDAEELERERGVVIQEIARSNDQPSDVADRLLDEATYGQHPLGRPVLGPAEHLRSFSREGIVAFRERQWAPTRGGA